MKKSLEIRQEDIVRGKRCSVFECPVSIAAERQFGVLVFTTGITIWQYQGIRFWKLSSAGITFILDYDRGLPVQPCTIEVEEVEVGSDWS